MPEKSDKKIIFEESINCPWCSKKVIIKKIKKTIEEPTKGEYKEYTEVEKDVQTKLQGE